MTRHYLNRNASAHFTNALLTALLVGLGVTDPDDAESLAAGRSFRVETAFGLMTGSFHPGHLYFGTGRRYSHPWIHFRFAEVDRAKNDLLPSRHNLNPWSGKWNFMFSNGDNANVEAAYIVHALRSISARDFAII